MVKIETQSAKNLRIAREEMGRGWPKKIMERTGFKRTYILEAIQYKRLDAKIWDAVEELKKEHQAFLKDNQRTIKKIFKTAV